MQAHYEQNSQCPVTDYIETSDFKLPWLSDGSVSTGQCSWKNKDNIL